MLKNRLIYQLIVGFIVLILPIPLNTRLVVSFICAVSVGILFLFRKIQRFAPWQLVRYQHPNPKIALVESLIYTASSYGLLAYLASSEHAFFHFILGFLGIIWVWLIVQLIYSEQYALRHYWDDKGLLFPDCPQPHWTEFLYQGFCIASCYQTSDTTVTTSAMRQLITMHALLSYTLSVSIIAVLFGLVGSTL